MNPDPPQPSVEAPTTPSIPPVLVLAEDDDELRESLCEFLSMEGYLVREVADVDTLRAETASDEPRVIIVDVHLANGDCAELIAELVGRGGARIVLMSGDVRAARLAATHSLELLTKPFDLAELLRAVRANAG